MIVEVRNEIQSYFLSFFADVLFVLLWCLGHIRGLGWAYEETNNSAVYEQSDPRLENLGERQCYRLILEGQYFSGFGTKLGV